MTQLKPVRAVAVTSGKGGVGKTNISINLSIALSELGQRVLLFDADMGLANVDVLLGLQPRFNLSHVLAGERQLDEVLISGPAGLKIIPGSSGIQKLSELSIHEQGGVIRAFSDLPDDFDILMVDTAAGISGSVINFVRAAQDVVVVLCDEPTSLTDAYAVIKLLNRDYGLFRFHLVANMVTDARHGRTLFMKLCKVTDRYLDVTLNFLGSVPRDESLRKAVQRQTAVIQAFPQSAIAQAFRDLARKVDNLPAPESSSGRLEFFVERMIQYGQNQGTSY